MVTGIMTILDIETNDLDKQKGNILSCGMIDILPKETKNKPSANAYNFGTDEEPSYVEGIILVSEKILYFWNNKFNGVGREDIHHLSEAMLREHESEFNENLIQMASKLQNGNIITFNGDWFDIPYCCNFLKRNNILVAQQSICSYDMRTLVGPTYRKANNISGQHGKLIEMAEWLGYDSEYKNKAHDALEDCKATMFLFEKLALGEMPVIQEQKSDNPLDDMRSAFGV